MTHRTQTQSQALMTLLELDDKTPRMRTEVSPPRPKRRRSGKENMVNRKQMLPQLSSKNQLKKILQKLQDSPQKTGCACSVNGLQVFTMQRSKPAFERKKKPLRTIETSSGESRLWTENDRNDEIRQVMRRNNYSANALNLKTMSILQQLYSTKQRQQFQLTKPPKTNPAERARRQKGKTIVAFMRKGD